MKRFLFILTLFLFAPVVRASGGTCPSGVPSGVTSCYFAAPNLSGASDSNNGTSESTPWLHLPGQPNCSNTCAGVTPAAGEGFIVRGGDTYHGANASPSTGVYMGAAAADSCGTQTCGWVWQWSGSNGSPIYIGVDLTWYNSTVCGGSWCRPIINLDNPTSTSLVSSCSYDLNGASTPQSPAFGSIYGVRVNYLILDNFEFTGACGSAGVEYLFQWGDNLTFEHLYMHGWTETSSGHDSGLWLINGNDTGGITFPTNDVIEYSVFDGSDSYCTGYETCSGVLGAGITSDFDHNIVRYLSSAVVANTIVTCHDNLFEYLYESWDSDVHSDVEFNYGNENPTNSNMYFYNNMVRNVATGQIVTLTKPSGTSTVYVFNNVFWENNGAGGASNGNVSVSFTANDTTVGAAYVTNNTFDQQGSGVKIIAAQGPNGQPDLFYGTVYLQNNHWIGPNGVSYTTNDNPNATVTDNGNEVTQSESVANGQGYTTSNNYQPTAATNATVHAGANLSSSCSTYSSDSDLCNGTTGGVTNTAGSGVIPTLYISSPAARGTTWDSGAYQFASGASGGGGSSIAGATQLQGKAQVNH